MFIKKATVILVTLSLISCASTNEMNKAQKGSYIGALAGAGLGALAGNGKNKGKATILGGFLGGLVGYGIGSSLDERDRIALKTKTIEALDSAKTNETVLWISDHTEASAEITPIRDTIKSQPVNFSVHASNDLMVTTATLNIRKGPGSSYEVIDAIQKGTEVSVKGLTDNGWSLIEKENRNYGFVSNKYLIKNKTTAIDKNNKIKLSDIYENSSDIENNIEKSISIPKNEKQSIRNDKIHEITVNVPVQCRTVIVREKINGTVSEREVETCKDVNGSWGA